MSNLANTPKAGLSGKKIAVIATAILLLAAIIFGIVWTNIEHAFRYDKEDLTPYYVLGDLNAELLASLGIEVETNVTTDGILDKIEEKLISYYNSDKLSVSNGAVLETGKDGDGNITAGAVNSAVLSGDTVENFGDIVWIYYEVMALNQKDKDGNVVAETPVLTPNLKMGVLPTGSSLTNATETSATKVRLGSGDLNLVIEKILNDSIGNTAADAKTYVQRWTDESHLVTPGDNLVLKVKMTYTDASGATKTILDAKEFSYFYTNETVTEEQMSGMYKGATELGFSSDLWSVLKADLSNLVTEWIAAEGRKVTDKTTGTLKDKQLTETDTNLINIDYEIEILSAFEAKYKLIDNYKLTEKLTYKDSEGTSKTLDVNDELRIRVYVEKAISLQNPAVYTAIANDEADADYKAFRDAWIATLNGTAPTVAQEYAKYVEYTKDAMIAEYVRTQTDRKDNETDEEYATRMETLHATVSSALWQRLVKDYTDTVLDDGKYVISYPEDEVQRYFDAYWESYRSTYYSNSGNYTTKYPNGVAEYILKEEYKDKVEDVSEYNSLDATALRERAEAYILADIREEIGAKLLLFSLADHLGLELDRDDIKGAKQELYDYMYAQYAYYQSLLYTSSYGAAPTAPTAPKTVADTATQEEKDAYQAALAEYNDLKAKYDKEKAAYDERKARRVDSAAKSAANDYVDSLGNSYLREYAMLIKVQKTIVPTETEALLSYIASNVTWVKQGETAED